MGTKLTESQQVLLSDLAHKLIGVPYEFAAEISYNTPVENIKSIDCSELVEYVYRHALGIIVPDGSKYQHQASELINPELAECGDLAFKHKEGIINHVGLIVFDRQIIEAEGWYGKVIKRPLAKFMTCSPKASQFDSVRRLRVNIPQNDNKPIVGQI